MTRTLVSAILALTLAGCSTTPPPVDGPSVHGVRVPSTFTAIPSRIPKEEWKRVFFRLARDVRLLPRLHPHIHDIQVTLFRDENERTLLFIAHARLTRNAEENFWKTETRRLYQPELNPDFVQIRHYPTRSLTESEAYLREEEAAKTVVTVSDDRRGNVHLIGGSRLLSGEEPFVLDRIIRTMTNELNR